MGVREFWLSVLRPWQKRRRLNGNFPRSTTEPAPATAAVPQPMKRRKSQG
jgi:hypothetical protein